MLLGTLGLRGSHAIQPSTMEQKSSFIYEVDINAGQGQIILHLPLTSSFPEQNVSRARFEIAKIAIIAAITGIIATGSFRVPDVALGRPIAA